MHSQSSLIVNSCGQDSLYCSLDSEDAPIDRDRVPAISFYLLNDRTKDYEQRTHVRVNTSPAVRGKHLSSNSDPTMDALTERILRIGYSE